MKSPHRYDVVSSSCVNNEVLNFKRQAAHSNRAVEVVGAKCHATSFLNNLNLSGVQNCKVCGAWNTTSTSACIIAIHRAPSGNFDLFITKLDTVLRKLYTSTLEYIICGDININYLVDSDKKSQLEALLEMYNLISVVKFPTCTQQNSATAIDNIFIDITRMGNCSICPIINGLSDHDAQSITLHSFMRPPTKKCVLIRERNTQ